MGWKGTVRSVGAAIRAADRDAKRRQRELEKERKYYEKMELLEQAEYEVRAFENYIEIIQSIHKECSDKIDWHRIAGSESPEVPQKATHNETKASYLASQYKPGLFDRLLGRTERRRAKINEAIPLAKEEDEKEYQSRLEEWKEQVADWEESKGMADRLLNGDKDSKIQVIRELNPFTEISNIGSSIFFQIHPNSIVEAEINVHGTDIVPSKKKTLLQSGKLSMKNMPKGEFYEIYQDYVCSCALRIANELFAILPENMVVVTAVDELLNAKTGHLEELPILSVAIPRKSLESLNMQMVDPSDSMDNFIHEMSFKKTTGFNPVDRVNITILSNEYQRR
ncbi:hypothetical protein ACM25P_01005 [Vreelandella alkaliphila]|uniref:hypothetical protein n=1 Tax=Vreelandella alkaliphila TaxID=272774 RepID=UPI0039F46C13